MKIGTFLDQLDIAVSLGEIADVAEGFAALVPMGLQFVDPSSTMVNKYGVETIKKWLDRWNVEAGPYIHPVEFPYDKENVLQQMREDTELQLSRMKVLGSKYLMLVPILPEPPMDEQHRKVCQDKIVDYGRVACEQAKGYGIDVLMENYSNAAYPYSTVADMAYILESVPQCGYILDTGNFWFNNSQVLTAATAFAGRTKHVHLKDLQPNPQGYLKICGNHADSVSLGCGEIPLKQILSILQNAVYDGTLTIEVNTNQDMLSKIMQSMTYLKSLNL